MTKRDVEAEVLNAYVDGELPPVEAAYIARAAARSPAIATRIATLRDMKAAIADAVPERDLDVAVARERPPASS